MNIDTFKDSPWKHSHPAYDQSGYNIRPAPEYANAETLVASTYRACGFDAVDEKDVTALGTRFERSVAGKRTRVDPQAIGPDFWAGILHGAIESPRRPRQSARRSLQLCPIVPDVALYSGTARLTGNTWNPGQLIQRMVALGCRGDDEAQNLWRALHRGLSVESDDDVWARWLDSQFGRWRPSQHVWAATRISTAVGELGPRTPASQFVKDLRAVLRAKPCMTRRQWVSLLEALLRIASVAHVLWLCEINFRIWQEIRRLLEGAGPLSEDQIRGEILAPHSTALVYGQPGVPTVRSLASKYLESRVGINLVLWALESRGCHVASLSSVEDIKCLSAAISERRVELGALDLSSVFNVIVDAEARTVSCKKGIGSNMVEFIRHALGQRETADDILRGYDQGYFLRKRTAYKTAPWIVSLGPVALLALVHCCLEEVAGPRSVHRLSEHLAWYGLRVDHDDLAGTEIGTQLRMLGLILDSPDAESGMLLIPPFNTGDPSTDEGTVA